MEEFGDDVNVFKKVKGVRIAEGTVEYTPSVTLSEFSRGDTVYKSDITKIFENNTLLLQHFQFFLNSRLSSEDTVSGIADEATAIKIASIFKNEHIANTFANILETYGSDNLRILRVGEKVTIVSMSLSGESIAVLDLPNYDATGTVSLVNEYNKMISNLPLSALKNISSLPGLDDNAARSILKKWTNTVNEETNYIEHRKIENSDIQSTKTKAL